MCSTIDEIAATFGDGATGTVDGELDCDPVHPGRLLCWQYGVRLETASNAEQRLVTAVAPELARTGWQTTDRSTASELIAQFSREGANINVHVGGGAVAIIGSTRCLDLR